MPAARLGFGDHARRGRRLGRAVEALRQAAVRRPAGAGDRTRRTRPRRRRHRRRQMGAPGAAAAGPARLRRRPSCRAAARPSPANASSSPTPARRCARSRETEGEAFYRGDIAEQLVAARAGQRRQHDAGRPGRLPARMGRARSARTSPATRVHEIPPNGQGIAALMALGMLDQLDLGRLPVDSVESQHLQIEAMKLAFADTYRWVADARAMTEVTRRRSARRRLPGRARQADRPAPRRRLQPRHAAERRHDLPDRRRRERHDDQPDPVELHGLRQRRRRARHRRQPAEPRLRLHATTRRIRTSSRRASGRSTPSSRAS